MIVQAMLMPGSVGQLDDLMANVSSGAEGAIESPSFPTFHHDRTVFHSTMVHSVRSMLHLATDGGFNAKDVSGCYVCCGPGWPAHDSRQCDAGRSGAAHRIQCGSGSLGL